MCRLLLNRSGSIFRRLKILTQNVLASRAEQFAELWRYYSVGVINSVFGYSIYAVLIFIHLNLYLAQILGHLIGMVFNYFMFSIHVFPGIKPALRPYIVTYAINYALGLIFITLYHDLFLSAYVAGLFSIVTVSLFNYVLLKKFVFKKPRIES